MTKKEECGIIMVEYAYYLLVRKINENKENHNEKEDPWIFKATCSNPVCQGTLFSTLHLDLHLPHLKHRDDILSFMCL